MCVLNKMQIKINLSLFEQICWIMQENIPKKVSPASGLAGLMLESNIYISISLSASLTRLVKISGWSMLQV